MILITQFKRIEFIKFDDSESGKTTIWYCWNYNGVLLGMVAWDANWRQYAFEPEVNIKLAGSCFESIGEFCKNLRRFELDKRKGSKRS